MNYFTDIIDTKEIFKTSKVDSKAILLSEATVMEKCYERLFTPRANQMINENNAAGLFHTAEETALIDALMREFITKYAT